MNVEKMIEKIEEIVEFHQVNVRVFAYEIGACSQLIDRLVFPTGSCPIVEVCSSCSEKTFCKFYANAKNFIPEPETAREYHLYLYGETVIIRELQRLLQQYAKEVVSYE